ncbi:MAG: alpha-glucosidase C-terminal domain-containing protein [Desulfobacterota bacterium]|nr:alpha-glucosidase C-terminal domain-containing protein [Thermodesulfobacteriota bacterium]
MRTSPEGEFTVLTVTNVTRIRCRVEIPLEDVKRYQGPWHDLLSEKKINPKKDRLLITLQPYEVVWLVPESQTTQTEQC